MDDKIFRLINQFTGQFRILDIIMIMLSNKLRYLFAFFMLFMWLRDTQHKKITSFAGISAIITFLITSLIKMIYFKPRPYTIKRVNLLAPVLSKKNSSFPSKHTTLAFAVAISVLFYKRFSGCILSILAFLSGLSRIWMGQHYPSDIIGSALIGSLVAIGVKITSDIWNPVIARVIKTYHRIFYLH